MSPTADTERDTVGEGTDADASGARVRWSEDDDDDDDDSDQDTDDDGVDAASLGAKSGASDRARFGPPTHLGGRGYNSDTDSDGDAASDRNGSGERVGARRLAPIAMVAAAPRAGSGGSSSGGQQQRLRGALGTDRGFGRDLARGRDAFGAGNAGYGYGYAPGSRNQVVTSPITVPADSPVAVNSDNAEFASDHGDAYA